MCRRIRPLNRLGSRAFVAVACGTQVIATSLALYFVQNLAQVAYIDLTH